MRVNQPRLHTDAAFEPGREQRYYTDVVQIDKSAWEELLETASGSSFFQSPQCYELYETQPFMEPFVCASGKDQTLDVLICGYIIREGTGLRAYFSRRAIVPGGMLIRPGLEKDVINKTLEKLRLLLKSKCIYLEIRNYSDFSIWKDVFQSAGFLYNPHLNIVIDTTDRRRVWTELSASRRKQIQSSFRIGAQVERAHKTEDISELYRLLSHLYHHRVHKPLFPESFFQSLLFRKEHVILLIRYQGVVRGGIVCVLHKNESVSEWFVCGDDRCGIKGLYPSVLATWAAIDYATAHGFKRFDFMGAGSPEMHYGVRDFKLRFGGELHEYGRFLVVTNKLLYRTGCYAYRLFRKVIF